MVIKIGKVFYGDDDNYWYFDLSKETEKELIDLIDSRIESKGRK